MNVRNEADNALDEAIKRHLGHLFDTYFHSAGEPEAKTKNLLDGLRKLEGSAEAVTKVLDDL